MINGAHQVDQKSNGFAGRELSLGKGLEAFRTSAAGCGGNCSWRGGQGLASRGLECQAQRLGFHHRSARETLKRDQMSLALWKGSPEAEWRLEQSG